MPSRLAIQISVRIVPLALFLLPIDPTPLLAQPIPAAEVERFAERLNESGEAAEGRTGPAYARVWDAMDSIVLRRLNAGAAPGGVGALLEALPGYSGPSEGESHQVGNTTFYGSLPRQAPNYLAAPLVLGRDTLVLGIYSLMDNLPGRLSVYARQGGRWRRAGRHDAPRPLSAHLLQPVDSTAVLVAFEDFVGADRSEARARVIRVGRSGVRVERAERGRMVDPRVEPGRDGVAVTWDSFPRRVGAAVLGPRLTYRTTYRLSRGRVVADTASLTPWMEVLETLLRHQAAGRTRSARALAANDSAYRAVVRVAGASVAVESEGDAARGEGWVDFWSAESDTTRVTSRRGADGRWRVVSIAPAPASPGR